MKSNIVDGLAAVALGMAFAAGFRTHAQAAVPAHKALSKSASGLPAAGRFRVAEQFSKFQLLIYVIVRLPMT